MANAAHDRGRPGAERHAHAELARALPNHETEHTEKLHGAHISDRHARVDTREDLLIGTTSDAGSVAAWTTTVPVIQGFCANGT
jgi:hypothetical protein